MFNQQPSQFLYSGGRKSILVPYEKDKFFIPDTYNEYRFTADKQSIINEIIIKNRRRMQTENVFKLK